MAPEAQAVAHSVSAVTASVLQQRVDHLLACIQPNAPSELRRLTIAAYVSELISRCFAPQRQVEAFTFGSVPLRTYLPDGDVDISMFTILQGPNDGLKHTWATQLLRSLEKEASRRDAPFRIRDCQIIQAEVKLVKCVVADVVVDVSFNALGGLCTVAFLEWVDRAVGRGHLFKRSVVLVKAWCYYESRLLGAHHGLISSYALEAMVMYVFNLHGATLASPLEVLQRFLEVFAAFDWDKYCLSMIGPIHLSSFPHPRLAHEAFPKGPLLLEHAALRDAIERYSVRPAEAVAAFDGLTASIQNVQTPEGSSSNNSSAQPAGQSTEAAPAPGGDEGPSVSLQLKYLNIMDPLFPGNNLGRSVSKASFSRIRFALAFGANSLSRLLQLEPQAASEGITAFFKNTWRSPTRMAADNQVFQSRLAMGGAAWLPGRAAVAGGHGLSNVPVAGISSSLGRRHSSSLSLPEINAERSPFEDPGANDSLEVHDGRSTSPVRPSTSRVPPPLPLGRQIPLPAMLPPQPALNRVEHARSMSDVGNTTWRSMSQPTSPVLSPRAGGPAAAAGSPTGIRPEVVTMSLGGRSSRHALRNNSTKADVDAREVESHSGHSTPKVRQASLPPSPSGPAASSNIQTLVPGRDIFTADMDVLMRNLAIARQCHGHAPQGAAKPAPPPAAASGVEKKQKKKTTAAAAADGNVQSRAAQQQPADEEDAGEASDRATAQLIENGLAAQMMASLPSVRVMPSSSSYVENSYATVTAQGLTPKDAPDSAQPYDGRNDSTTASAASSVANTPTTMVKLGTVVSPTRAHQQVGVFRKTRAPQREPAAVAPAVPVPAPVLLPPLPASSAGPAPVVDVAPPRGVWGRPAAPEPQPAAQVQQSPTVAEAAAMQQQQSQSKWSTMVGKQPSRLGPLPRVKVTKVATAEDALPAGTKASSERGAGSSQSTPSFAAAVLTGKGGAFNDSGSSTPVMATSPRVSSPKAGTWAAAAASSPKLKPKPKSVPGSGAAVEGTSPLFKDISFKLEGEEFPSLAAAPPSR